MTVEELESELDALREKIEPMEEAISNIKKDIGEAIHRIKYRNHALTKEEQLEYFEQVIKDIDQCVIF